MIICRAQASSYVVRRRAIEQDIVRGLEIEALLDLRIRRSEQMQEDEGGDQEVEGEICS